MLCCIMIAATAHTSILRDVSEQQTIPDQPPKTDWPLMGDVACFRAGVPEALIRWRAARGEQLPDPSDPAVPGN